MKEKWMYITRGFMAVIIVIGSLAVSGEEKSASKEKEPTKTPAAEKKTGNSNQETKKTTLQEKGTEEKKSEEKAADVLPWATTYKEIKNRLETTKMSFEWKDKTLTEVVEYFQYLLCVNFQITPKANEEVGDKTVSLQLKNVTAKIAVRIAIKLFGLKCLYENGSLVVMTEDETVEGEYILVIYRIDDLTTPPPQEVQPPQVDVESKFATAAGNAFPVPPPVSGIQPKKEITAEEVKEAIIKQTGGKSWDEDKRVAIAVTKRIMVVTQTKEVHKQIVEVLNKLREGK